MNTEQTSKNIFMHKKKLESHSKLCEKCSLRNADVGFLLNFLLKTLRY